MQLRTFDELLAVGGERPTSPAGLVDQLRTVIEEGVRGPLERWTQRSLWVGKSQLASVTTCEGKLLAEASAPKDRKMFQATAVGIVVHRAIQIAHTHPGRTVDEYVRLAVAGSRSEESFAEFWDAAAEHVQSDCQVAAASRVVGFLDAFPPLDASWTPRFEESLQVKVGGLTLSARPDLLLGRPRADGVQTMFIADVKSTDLRESHLDEARFYALVSTLRHGCPPFRSVVYSLTTGEWTDPDVDAVGLMAAAQRVVDAVSRMVDVLTESRPAVLTAGHGCTWCPAKAGCAGFVAWDEAGRPEVVPAMVARVTATPGTGTGVEHGAPAGGAEVPAAVVTPVVPVAPPARAAVGAGPANPWALD